MEFEKAIQELEEVVRKLEAGNIGLQEAIELYNRGLHLRELCSKQLAEAKMKIEVMTEKEASNA